MTITDADLERMERTFSGFAPADLEHVDTVLNGELGGLIEVKKKGDVLFGAVKVPTYLHAAIKKQERL